MFPIPSEQPLSFAEVAQYWSREIRPRASFNEVLNELVKAWWRGNLMASGARRVDLLRTIYKSAPHLVAFAFPNSVDPPRRNELLDGSVEVLWLYRVPLPSAEPESWGDDNCTEAFQAIAAAWDLNRFSLTAPVVSGLEVTQADFSRWVESQGYRPFTFWAGSKEEEQPSPGKRLSKPVAAGLAQDYIRCERQEGRVPTQHGFEKKVCGDGWHGGREFLREEYKRAAKQAGIETKQGPPRKNRE
jgi:hypothetical protein